ncbi:hypothetical protein F5Y14DRAFT_390870 [Nemania sp. NC0429]|nr:hypothetical protein F5Y14DRAFT_390870 [Nemania sp. NC0429]
MMLKLMTLILALAFSALAGPITKLPAELPVTVLEGSSPNPATLELSQASEKLLLYRSRLGENGTHALVAADLVAADAYWHKTIADSKGGFVGAMVRARAYAPHAVLNATAVGQVLFDVADVGWRDNFLSATPEHYLASRRPDASHDNLAADVAERWGPSPITYFHAIPVSKLSFMPALHEFPVELQMPLGLALSDDTVFAYTLTALRDLPGGHSIELVEGLWLPDSTPGDIVKAVRAHNTVEYTNWLKLAYKAAMAAL